MSDETMGNQQEVSEARRIWFAGLLNGDGCFSLTFRVREKKLKCDMSITLTQCDPCLVERAAEIMAEIGINAHLVEYPPTGAGIRSKWNVRVTKMSQMLLLIAAVSDHMVGEKQAQAKLMQRYIGRRLYYADIANRHNANIADDPESLRIAAEFYQVRRLEVPKEIAHVLNDYPGREYTQAGGSAQHAVGMKI